MSNLSAMNSVFVSPNISPHNSDDDDPKPSMSKTTIVNMRMQSSLEQSTSFDMNALLYGNNNRMPKCMSSLGSRTKKEISRPAIIRGKRS